MKNRFGTEIKRGDLVSFHTSRGEVASGFVAKFFRISGYGWRIQTTRGTSCGVDDVIKVTREFIRRGCMIEVGTGKLGYRWVQGWETFDPCTGAWSVPMHRADALTMAADMRNRWSADSVSRMGAAQ